MKLTYFVESVSGSDFDFLILLQKLSAVVYNPLLYLVHYNQSSELNQQWNITKFNACLPLQPTRKELMNNCSSYIEHVKQLFEDAIHNLQQSENMTNEHIDEANAYLHIQGHKLYNLYSISALCSAKELEWHSKRTFSTSPSMEKIAELLEVDIKELQRIEKT